MSDDRKTRRVRSRKKRNRQRIATMKLRRLVDFSHRSDRPNRVTSIGPIDIMKQRRQISEEGHLAAGMFACAWEAKNGSNSIGAMRYEFRPRSGRPLAPQEIEALRLHLAAKYDEACRQMDPTTRYVLQAVACELMSLESIDRLVERRKGWAVSCLNRGIQICGKIWAAEIIKESREQSAA